MKFAPGEGVVEVEAGGRLARLAAASPLQLLTPKNHGSAAWVYAASLGGGLVGGDRIKLDVRVRAGASAYLTTQSATKVYAGAACQELDAAVDDDALLVSVPDPVVCFADADYRQRVTCRLEPRASLVCMEALTAGRVEHGERWRLARYASRLRVERAGRPIFNDGLLLDPAHGALPERLGRFAALATLYAVGPRALPLRAPWLALPPAPTGSPAIAAASAAGDDAVVVRLAAVSAFALLAALRPLLAPIADLLGDDPFARKW